MRRYKPHPLRQQMTETEMHAALRELMSVVSALTTGRQSESRGNGDSLIFTGGDGTTIGADADGQIVTVAQVGDIPTFPIAPADTTLYLRFLGAARIARDAGTFRLPDRYAVHHPDHLLGIVSDGQHWREFSRSEASIPTFVPIGKFPNTLAAGDVTDAVQYALDNVEQGSWLYVDRPLQIDGGALSITRSNLGLWLAPGGALVGNHPTSTANLLEVSGSLGSPTTLVTADIAEREFLTIAVASTVGFAQGDWILVGDQQKPSASTAPDHREPNRIDSIIDATHIKLMFTTSDSYTVADSAYVQKFTPVENVRIAGGGRISNAGAVPGGGHGIRFGMTVDCGVQDLNFEDVRQEALKFDDCRDFYALNNRLGYASRFDSNGYGITTGSVVGGLLYGNRAHRLRHAYDISFFSRDVTVAQCHAHSSPFTPFMVHPKCKRIKFIGCLADGVAGYDNADPDSMVETGPNLSHGFAVREENAEIEWVGGTIANTAGNGADLTNNDCKNVSVHHSFFYRTNTSGGRRAAIYCRDGEGLSATFPGLSVKGNVLFECYGVGAFLSFDDAVAEDNFIVNMQKGTDSPTGVSGFTRAIGVLLSIADRNGVEPAVTPARMISRRNTVIDVRPPIQVAAADDATDVLTLALQHGLTTDWPVTVVAGSIGVLPTGLTAGTVYYARSPTAYTLELAAAPGGAAVDFTDPGSAPFYVVPGARLDRGVQLGGGDFIASLGNDWLPQHLVGLRSEDDRVFRSAGAGLWACPEVRSNSGFTALVTMRASAIDGGRAIECNQTGTDPNEASGIMAVDIDNVDDECEVDLDDCKAIACRRFGIESGFIKQLVRDCHAERTTAVAGVAGIGFFARTTGAAIEDLLYVNCTAHLNESDGFRCGTTGGAGILSGVRYIRPTMTFNGGNGINLLENGGGAIVAMPVGVGNADADIRVSHGGVRISNPTLDGAAVGAYGIDITASGNGTVLHNVDSFQHATAEIRDLGTNTRWDEDQWQMTSAAGTTTLTPSTRYHGVTGVAGGTVTLPAVALVPDGHEIKIKDEGGGATATPIVVDGNGAETIDGAAGQNIAVNYGVLTVKKRAGAWWSV